MCGGIMPGNAMHGQPGASAGTFGRLPGFGVELWVPNSFGQPAASPAAEPAPSAAAEAPQARRSSLGGGARPVGTDDTSATKLGTSGLRGATVLGGTR